MSIRNKYKREWYRGTMRLESWHEERFNPEIDNWMEGMRGMFEWEPIITQEDYTFHKMRKGTWLRSNQGIIRWVEGRQVTMQTQATRKRSNLTSV